MRWIMDLYNWTLKDDPRTWAGHSILSCLGSLVVGGIFWKWALIAWSLALAIGVSLAIWTYTVREVLEMHEHWETIRRKVMDHFLDVLWPAFMLNVLYRIFT